EALSRVNPRCEVTCLVANGPMPARTGGSADFEAVVLAQPASAQQLEGLAASIRPEGHLVARWGAPDDDLRAMLAASALVLRPPIDEGGTGVVRAQKLAPGRPARPALFLQTVACAPTMMDIRTRLPAQGLRSDPDLQ